MSTSTFEVRNTRIQPLHCDKSHSTLSTCAQPTGLQRRPVVAALRIGAPFPRFSSSRRVPPTPRFMMASGQPRVCGLLEMSMPGGHRGTGFVQGSSVLLCVAACCCHWVAKSRFFFTQSQGHGTLVCAHLLFGGDFLEVSSIMVCNHPQIQ